MEASRRQSRPVVVGRRDFAPDLIRLDIQAPDLAASVRPGQFVMVRVADDFDPLLRRPLSIHDRQGERIALLFKVVGRGTARLAKVQPGEEIDVFGPLGRPFPPVEGRVVLVGGGMGLAPLLFLAKESDPETTRLRLGAAGVGDLPGLDDFEALGLPLQVFTEDGSLGVEGLVTQGLAGELAERPATIMACGPEPMLRATAKIAARAGVECWVSLEARMACGLGACLGCVVEAADGSRPRVCADGPVFEARRIFGREG